MKLALKTFALLCMMIISYSWYISDDPHTYKKEKKEFYTSSEFKELDYTKDNLKTDHQYEVINTYIMRRSRSSIPFIYNFEPLDTIIYWDHHEYKENCGC